jgi:hypothetical protein
MDKGGGSVSSSYGKPFEPLQMLVFLSCLPYISGGKSPRGLG